MKFIIHPMLLVLLLTPSAEAQFRSLGWGDIPGSSDLSLECAQLPDTTALVIGFTLVDGFTTVQRIRAILDFCTVPEDLPEWWRFDQESSCRYEAMSVSTDFSSGPKTQRNPWPDSVSVDAALEFFPEWEGKPFLARVEITVTADTPITLVSDELYYACKILFANSKDDCVGCETPTCFVLNSFVVFTSPADEEGSRVWGGPDRYATWHYAPNCPFIVPVQEATWGGMKAKYE